jgi:hypothetical protein
MFHKKRFPCGLMAALAAAAVAFTRVGGLAAADPVPAAKEGAPDWSKFRYQSASECSRCHTQPTNQSIEQDALELVLLTESAIWRTHDKHAQAYAVLEGPRGKKMAELLGLKNARDVLKPEVGCLGCHAMHNLSKENQVKGGSGLAAEDGVSCGGCHGPSSDWVGPHISKDQWRSKSARAKLELGMRDLRDPERRAEVCVSCHVGNIGEGKVVTHAMFAAGHPPLPSFEIVNFSRNEPQHWRNPVDVPYFQKNRDNKEVIDNYHLQNVKFYEVQFSLTGAVVAFRENMRLAHDRANPEPASPATAWPELALGAADDKPADLRAEFGARWPEIAMAHSDCFACHHDLKYPGYRQERGFGYFIPGQELIRVTPGRPMVRSWPLAPLAAACNFTGKKERITELHRLLQALANATNERPFGQPANVRAATAALIKWSDDVLADLRAADYGIESVRRFIVDLFNGFQAPEGGGGYAPDYETARLTVSMVRAAYEGLARNLGPGWRARTYADTKDALNKLIEHLNLEPYTGRDERLKTVLGMIAKQLDDNGEVRFEKGIKAFDDYLKDIRDTEALKGLVKNDFLTQLSVQYTSGMFVKGILQPNIVSRLQEIGDKEEAVTLKDVSAYDPEYVRPLLKQFSEIVVRP